MAFFGFGIPPVVLDEEFDAPDIAADAELCRAIAAGRMGLHPDGWGNHDPLSLRWPLRDEPVPEPTPYQYHYKVEEVDPTWEAEHRRPAKRGPKPRPPPLIWEWVPQPEPKVDDRYGGTIKLTCDDCGAQFKILTNYDGGQRARRAAGLRELGAKEGWTHIVGRDRCPRCSGIPAPDNVGEGAGECERDEQHA